MDRVSGHRRALHVDIPELQGHEVSAQHVPAIMAEPDIRDAGDDLREEVACGLHAIADH